MSTENILRYMGHKGAADENLQELVLSCQKMLKEAGESRHAVLKMPCVVTGSAVVIDGSLKIESSSLSVRLNGCASVYIFAATLGAGVDRLIARRAKIDSAEALCLQACAAQKIENYCDNIEGELRAKAMSQGLYLRQRFSPGYGDFSIERQDDILRLLQAHKRIGLAVTKTHMLVPLKSITAIIGEGAQAVTLPQNVCGEKKCYSCEKQNCKFTWGLL